MEYQTTLKNEIKITGKGLHTGKIVSVTIKPTDQCKGVIFKRIDQCPVVEIPANVDYVSDTSRGTTLSIGDVRIATIEHLLSALRGMRIDNAIIETDGEEIPILDGSSKIWVEEIAKAGIVELSAERKYEKITENISYTVPEHGIEMIAIPANDFKITTIIDYKTTVLGEQIAQFDNNQDYTKEVAPCRTFVFIHELEFLQQNNLIKGGDVDNALVFVNKELSEEQLEHLAKLFNKDITKLEVHEGTLNNVQKYFDNEPARHKLLDFIGDLSLVGKNIKGHFMIKCPGHKANVAFAKLIKQHIENNKRKTTPLYDPSLPAIFNIDDIRKILPQKYPFLMVDKIVDMGKDYIIGIKNVTTNEPFFQGHFPDQQVMPGVLQIEAMAQVGGILVLKDVPDPELYSTYFMKIDEVKFRRMVIPGDTMAMKLKFTEPMRRGIVKMKGQVYVGSNLVCEATMMAKIIKDKNKK